MLKTNMIRFLLCALTLFCMELTWAQSGESILKMLVDKQMISQEDANTLIEESKKDEQNKTDNTLAKLKSAFKNSDIFKLSGYGQAVYQTSDNTAINNTMKINRIILFAEGNITSKLSYMFMYDFGPNSSLQEYYTEYSPIKALAVRFGQFKVPFTLENPMSPTRWEGIYGSLAVNALAGISKDVIGAKAGRDMGLQLSGKLFPKNDFYRIEYYTGLFNGTGVNTPENNNHKDLAGTLIFQPIKGLKLAGSGYSGKAPYAMPGDNVVMDHVRNRWSAGGSLSLKHIYARSEYIYGNDGGYHRDGAYAVGMWKILPDKLEVFGKYDYYNPDKEFGRLNKIYEYTGGINYYFSFLSRVQLNYIHTDNQEKIINTLAMQLQLFF